MKEPIWVLKSVVLKIHDAQISEHGGSVGLRDEGLLESALYQPQSLFSYGAPSLFDLATAYAERIAKNHPFVDGNKRTAYVTTALFLRLNGYALKASKEERVIKFVQLASDRIPIVDFSNWLKNNTMVC
ncbi:MAG: type II toxin-antitoxin system death-on-curing family toxin [Legionellales bacterium]|nr:type II toxin-antitoxin system death-on-curing family toxin [Legionellales bacterium]